MEPQKSLVDVEREVSRPLAHFPKGNMEDPLILSCISDTDHKAQGAYKERLSSLKDQVKQLFTASKANPIDNIKFIDTLCRLGVSYHFEKEIEEQLEKIFGSHDLYNTIRNDDECDLHTVGLAFQVFRQFGFKLSADVFEKFKDGDGKFKEHLGADVKGMLSLYEAAQWSTRGEDVLDEALIFSRNHLEGLASGCSTHLAVRIQNALKYSYHKCMTRLDTRQYISYYEEDETRDETLLTLAKVDFNLLQLLHREELAYICRWYKDLEVDSRVPYVRNRAVESYMWAVASYFEPQYSSARIILATVIIFVTILDDTYDAYGTPEELDLFTDALDRWLPNAPDELPDSMKYSYHIFIDFYEKLEKELEFLKTTFIEIGKSYYQETKWLKKDYKVMFDEFMENGEVTCTFHVVLAATFAGMDNIDKLEATQWQKSRPNIILAVIKIWRFMNDISGHPLDHERKHVGTSIDCYMKQYGVSAEIAKKEIEKIISDSWKDLNQELMRPHSVPYPILVRILNLTRACEVTYKYHEGFTQPEHLKDYMVSLFVKKIPI